MKPLPSSFAVVTGILLLAVVGVALAEERQPPTFFLMQVVKGETLAAGLAETAMEQRWQQQTLSPDPLRVKVELVTRYPQADNSGRQCARVRGQIGQDKVPLKSHAYGECADDTAGKACQAFYITTELDMCDDGLPPAANYTKYQAQAADPHWQPPVTASQGDTP